LRQDPDVIMVGEVRDQETAGICLRAALTGHFVLSTIHTNDSLSAVNRLTDMGIEPFLLASTLRVLEAQRLIRRLCKECKEPYECNPETAKLHGLEPGQLFLNVERYGNTSAASVAIALDEAVAAGRVQRGDLVLLLVFGAGFTWAAAVLEW